MFLSRDAILSSSNFQLDLPSLHNVNTKFALRLYFQGGNKQEQVVIEPLSSSDTNMTFLINDHHGFAVPHNDSEFGQYMFVGIPGPRLDEFKTSRKDETGFRANEIERIQECQGPLYSYFALYSGSVQTATESAVSEHDFLDVWLPEMDRVKNDDKTPKTTEFVFKLEIRVGNNNSCGLLALSHNWANVTGASVGLPFGKFPQWPYHLLL